MVNGPALSHNLIEFVNKMLQNVTKWLEDITRPMEAAAKPRLRRPVAAVRNLVAHRGQAKVREDAITEQDSTSRVDPFQVVRIVGSYLRHHGSEPHLLAALIVEVHRALAGVGRTTAVHGPLRPAVPIRRSVQQDYVVCLECGFRGRALRRHLRLRHNLEPTGYRARWKLPIDYPLTAPAYSARRSTIAKEIALGRRAAVPSTTEPVPPAPQPVSRRRGRRPRRPPMT